MKHLSALLLRASWCVFALGASLACDESAQRPAAIGDPVAACLDRDGDGLGPGCNTGRDCDDFDAEVGSGCAWADCSQTPTAPNCTCSGQGQTIECGEVHERVGDTVICGYGFQVCDEGRWSACRISTLPGRLRQALSGPDTCERNVCDPYCKEFLSEMSSSSTSTGAVACTVDPSCRDGVQNQGEAGVDCEGPCPKACASSGDLINTTFSSSAGGFSYEDDTFRGTNAPSSESGSIGGGDATLTLGQTPLSGANSGGIVQKFSSDVPVDVSFDWRLDMGTDFQGDECGEVLVSIDNVLYGTGSDDFVVQQCGGGTQSGTFTFTSNTLSAGEHTLEIGGFLNKNEGTSIVTRLEVENYSAYNNPSASGNNGGHAGGHNGFETSSDVDGSLNMGWTNAGDYVEWNYTAPVDGDYTVNVRIAGGGGSWSHNIVVDGVVVDTISGGSTGGWQTWTTATGSSFALSAGPHTVRLQCTSGNQNINYIELLQPATGPELTIDIDNVVVNAPGAGSCGDATCDATESCTTCISDCGECPVTSFCGDANCDTGENCSSCATDCGVCLSDCGDGTCDAGAGEGCGTCATDCGVCAPGPICGDGTCNGSEDCSSCESDCGVCRCGDGECRSDEDCSSCAADCGACPAGVTCGDAVCEGGETCGSCESDCGACAAAGCGDGTCGAGEDCGSCAADCGVCAACGDATCDSGEDCGSCESDCGACAIAPSNTIFLEAECSDTAAGNYANTSTAVSGYTGSGHITSSANSTSGSFDGSSIDYATYDVVVTAGNYDVWFRVDTDANASDDSWFWRIDSGTWTLENNHSYASFGWARGARTNIALSAGTHTIEIANREDGMDMDRLAVLPTGSSTPSGSGGTANNCAASSQCGNSSCDAGETCSTCATDCGACSAGEVCGDAVCEGTEDCSTCESDCGTCPASGCGDNVCDGGEDCSTCATDCGACAPGVVCGDAVCEGAEDCGTCQSDCGACLSAPSCGNSTCEGGETCNNCAMDCGVCGGGASCGDTSCDSGEDCNSCAVDCGACTDRVVCGDSACGTGEDCNSCAADCGSCGIPARCGDNTCDDDEDCANCATDCGTCGLSTCGNDICDLDEDCTTCTADCGACIPQCSVAPPPTDPCGNSVCEPTEGEDCGSCEVDCGVCAAVAACGDGTCDAASGEDCNTCGSDCGACSSRGCGDGTCEPGIGESCGTCSSDCGACVSTPITTCGNSSCESGETCSSCEADCGACPFYGTGATFNGGILATGTVTIADRVTVNGDLGGLTLNMGVDAVVTGDLETEGNATLRDRARVGGTLRVQGTLATGSGVTTGATESPASVSVPTLPTITVSPGGSNYTVPNDAVDSLSPGQYQNFHAYSRSTVTFTSGVYHFASVYIEPQVDILIDVSGGPVEWRVASSLEFQSQTTYSVCNGVVGTSCLAPGDTTEWGVYSDGTITVRPNVVFPSSLYAPNGTIQITNFAEIHGGMAAHHIQVDTDSVIGVGQTNLGWGSPAPPDPTPPAPVCGDTDCTPETGESCSNCSSDCGACEILPYCGDSTCDADFGESCSTCAADCGICPVTASCGDGTCSSDYSENCTTCAADCGVCTAPVVCGDSTCAASESCSSCALDCGTCPAYQTAVIVDDLEMSEVCSDDQLPIWATLSWQATTPADSQVRLYFRTAATQAELDSAQEVLVAVAANSAANGGFRYGPPAQTGAMQNGAQYLDDAHITEGIPRHGVFGRLRVELVPSSDGNEPATLVAVSIQTSCETTL